jgi:hypothetical protein
MGRDASMPVMRQSGSARAIKHMALGKLREILPEQFDEALILRREIRFGIGFGLQRIIHQFRLKNTIHKVPAFSYQPSAVGTSVRIED